MVVFTASTHWIHNSLRKIYIGHSIQWIIHILANFQRLGILRKKLPQDGESGMEDILSFT